MRQVSFDGLQLRTASNPKTTKARQMRYLPVSNLDASNTILVDKRPEPKSTRHAEQQEVEPHQVGQARHLLLPEVRFPSPNRSSLTRRRRSCRCCNCICFITNAMLLLQLWLIGDGRGLTQTNQTTLIRCYCSTMAKHHSFAK